MAEMKAKDNLATSKGEDGETIPDETQVQTEAHLPQIINIALESPYPALYVTVSITGMRAGERERDLV